MRTNVSVTIIARVIGLLYLNSLSPPPKMALGRLLGSFSVDDVSHVGRVNS